MPSVVMTYTNLYNDILNWMERTGDATLASTIPTIIAQAEFMLAGDLKTLLLKKSVHSAFTVGQPYYPKPVRWRETVTMNYGSGAGYNVRNIIWPRSYTYIRMVWPNPTLTDAPRFYGDYEQGWWIIAPTPDTAADFEVVYYEAPEPLADDNQTNVLTEFAPDLLLAAAMATTAKYLKDAPALQMWQADYQQALARYKGEAIKRVSDAADAAEEGV